MKLYALIIFSCVFAFYSCNSKKTGFFQNSYENYRVIKNPEQPSQKDMFASNASVEIKSNETKVSGENIHSLKEAKGKDFQTLTNTGKSEIKDVPKLSKEQKKQVKKEIKQIVKKAKETDSDMNVLLLVIIAILLPPVAVALVDGITGPFWLSILLTLLFYLPGLIYALYRIFRE